MKIPRKRRCEAVTFALEFAVEAGIAAELVTQGHGGRDRVGDVRFGWPPLAKSSQFPLYCFMDKRGINVGNSVEETSATERKGMS